MEFSIFLYKNISKNISKNILKLINEKIDKNEKIDINEKIDRYIVDKYVDFIIS